MLPFALLLGTMAMAPACAPGWWRHHYAKISIGLGAVTAGWYAFARQDWPSLGAAAHDYLGFIALVGSLFVVSGGIHIGIRSSVTPGKNVLFLLGGALLANLLGTTGAAMLLIRPWIQLNQSRIAAHHVVFFIFIVANVGGCLTPIGDPPLFLGYLQGVPFWWIAINCWPMWLLANGLLLGIFYVLDRKYFLRTPPATGTTEADQEKCTVAGHQNIFFLIVILGAIFTPSPLREGLMLTAAAGSFFTTKKTIHAKNGFGFHPLQEVAILFAGIFATMMPALAWLDHHAIKLLGRDPSPAIFFWGTGGLSSALDNAPTYLGFLSALRGVSGTENMAAMLLSHAPQVLAASLGAVFFGAATYIGNGPNFMVKAIAEQNGVRMPSFLEFILKFSLPFLLPVLITVWFLFFRS